MPGTRAAFKTSLAWLISSGVNDARVDDPIPLPEVPETVGLTNSSTVWKNLSKDSSSRSRRMGFFSADGCVFGVPREKEEVLIFSDATEIGSEPSDLPEEPDLSSPCQNQQ